MPLLALLRKVLLLCCQQAGCARRYLLKIIALLSRYIKFRRFLSERGLYREKTGRHDDDLGAKTSDTCMGTDVSLPSRPLNIERASPLACACSADIASIPIPAPETAPPGNDCCVDPSKFGETEVEVGESGSSGEFRTATGGSGLEESFKALEKDIKPMAPSSRPRYERKIKIKNETSRREFDQLGTYDLYRPFDIPSRNFDGMWRYYVHPEGLPYYHLEHSLFGHSFLTEADLQNKEVFREVESFMIKIRERLSSFEWKSIGRPRKIEVVLEIQGGWYYHMVDVERQIVFWLDKFAITHTVSVSYGFDKGDHFRPQLEYEYWLHTEHFPNHREFKREIYNEAIGALNHWRIDIITSADSTAPYDSSDIIALVESLRTLERTVENGNNNTYAVTGLARIMAIIWGDRLVHFYGSPGARLNINQSVREGPDMSRSLFIKFFASLLFFAPYSYLSGIERQRIDGLVQERAWKAYRAKLEQGWSSFVLTSTVLLNANVALLTTPIVLSDNGDDNKLFASPAAVASQVSIIASMGSIIIGLFLLSHIRTIRTQGDIDAQDFVEFVGIRGHVRFGLETLAILYSLPYALLMWGMVAFSISIAISCFLKIDGWPTTATQVIYAVAWLFVVPLIIWTVITNWEMSNQKHWSYLFSYDLITDLKGKGWGVKNIWSRCMSQNVTTNVDSHEMSNNVGRGTGVVSMNDTSTQPTSRDIQNGVHSEGLRVTSCV